MAKYVPDRMQECSPCLWGSSHQHLKGHLNKAHCFFGQKDAPRTTSGSESSIWQVLAVHSSLSHCSLFHCSLFHCFTVHSHCSLFPWFTAQVFCSSVFLCLTGWIRDEISKDPSLGNSSQHLQARCVSASGPLICKIFLSGCRMMKCFFVQAWDWCACMLWAQSSLSVVSVLLCHPRMASAAASATGSYFDWEVLTDMEAQDLDIVWMCCCRPPIWKKVTSVKFNAKCNEFFPYMFSNAWRTVVQSAVYPRLHPQWLHPLTLMQSLRRLSLSVSQTSPQLNQRTWKCLRLFLQPRQQQWMISLISRRWKRISWRPKFHVRVHCSLFLVALMTWLQTRLGYFSCVLVFFRSGRVA